MEASAQPQTDAQELARLDALYDSWSDEFNHKKNPPDWRALANGGSNGAEGDNETNSALRSNVSGYLALMAMDAETPLGAYERAERAVVERAREPIEPGAHALDILLDAAAAAINGTPLEDETEPVEPPKDAPPTPPKRRVFWTILDLDDYRNLATLGRITDLAAVEAPKISHQRRASNSYLNEEFGEALVQGDVRGVIDRAMQLHANRPLNPQLVGELMVNFPAWQSEIVEHNGSSYTLLHRQTGQPSADLLSRSAVMDDRVCGWTDDRVNILTKDVRPIDIRLMLDIESALLDRDINASDQELETAK